MAIFNSYVKLPEGKGRGIRGHQGAKTHPSCRTGSTVEALKSICQQAGAKYLGAGAIIHNRLNGQPWDGDLESLAQVG